MNARHPGSGSVHRGRAALSPTVRRRTDRALLPCHGERARSSQARFAPLRGRRTAELTPPTMIAAAQFPRPFNAPTVFRTVLPDRVERRATLPRPVARRARKACDLASDGSGGSGVEGPQVASDRVARIGFNNTGSRGILGRSGTGRRPRPPAGGAAVRPEHGHPTQAPGKPAARSVALRRNGNSTHSPGEGPALRLPSNPPPKRTGTSARLFPIGEGAAPPPLPSLQRPVRLLGPDVASGGP